MTSDEPPAPTTAPFGDGAASDDRELPLDPYDVGLDWHVADPPGIGGRLRDRPEDFRVEEQAHVALDPDGAYCVVEATLRDRETHRFARDLSDAVGVSRKRVSWAGTKDRRAVTTQHFTVYDVAEDAVAAVDLPGVELAVVGRSHHELGLGDLEGNAFTIRVRGVTRPERLDAIRDDVDGFGGYPNLFGPQRFGSRRPITHAVGEAILAGDHRAAVHRYLATAFDAEPDATRAAREELAAALADADGADDRDAAYRAALEAFPVHLGFERALLNALVDGAAPREALDALPDNLQRLFVNAAQSRLFNVTLRRRRDAGLPFDAAVAGDVVAFVDDDGHPDADALERVTERNVDTVNRHVARGRAVVTAPLVGSATRYADGAPGRIERGVVEDAGLDRDAFDRSDGYGARGTRREVLIAPELAVERDGDDAVFAFDLRRGCYATAVMREYVRGDGG